MFARSGSIAAEVAQVLDVVGLGAHADRHPTELSLGQQKMVGVARALAGRPSVLLLDEPAAGLDSAESASFGHQVRRIADSGIAVLLIDHDMSLVLEVCDRVAVLDFGVPIAYGTPADVRVDERVLTAYLGVEVSELSDGSAAADGLAPS